MGSHPVELEANGQAVKSSTVLCCWFLSSAQKQVRPLFVARLHFLKCAKLQLYGYCSGARSQSCGQ